LAVGDTAVRPPTERLDVGGLSAEPNPTP